MPIQRHDIYLIRWRLRESFDFRPCVVLQEPNDDNTAIILVSSSDLNREGYDFKIDREHPNFPATGLRSTSYVVGDQIYGVPTERLSTFLGRLEGELAREFDAWID